MSTGDNQADFPQSNNQLEIKSIEQTHAGNGESSAHENESGADSQPTEEHDRTAEAVGTEMPARLPFPVIGIGGSAGGLEAFTEFFAHLPAETGMAFIVVQHLPPERESMVAEILSRRTKMPVQQVEDALAVEVNHVYVIRPGRTLTIKDGLLHLGDPVEKPGHRKPVDDFFRSLAEEQRERAVGIVMSGMGSNGSAGAQAIKAVGGVCIAQDPESAKFPSMPRNLIDLGMADFVLRPEQMPEVLLRYARHPYVSGNIGIEETLKEERKAFNEILAVLRTRSRQEFSGYKKPTVLRRIQRRMSLHQLTQLGDYARLLRVNFAEATALADDLVIHVTGFFRDPDAWETLRRKVIVPMIAEREANTTVRVWVTACSSGEEAYTMAMLLTEAADRAGKEFDIKIFATDVADRTLAQARQGIYPGGIEGEMSPERLDRFFDKDDAMYRVKKELRECVIFAPQNVLQDPPFSKLDICTCRNLLIYLEPVVQKRVLSLLHFGLREGGALFLGSSETVAGAEDLFSPIDKKWRIYRRVGPTRHGAVEFPQLRVGPLSSGLEEEPTGLRSTPHMSIAMLTQRALLASFTPPAVVVDRQHRVVFFHGDTSPFLQQPEGEPTRDFLSMVRDGIRAMVRIALHKAFSEGAASTVRDGLLSTPDGRMRIAVTIAPLAPTVAADLFLVGFESWPEPPPPQPKPEGGNGIDERRLFVTELQRMRDELQSAVEELQTSNEELRASNEEVTSVNEELQSTNEELETSKEELQSLNEELTTVNAQLQAKMEELEATSNDLSSLLSSTDIAVIFLDRQFRIRRFTPSACDLVELIPSDIGRPLNDLACKFADPELIVDIRAVLDKLIPREKEVLSTSGRWYVRSVLPYRTIDARIDGIVVTFIDITRRRQAEVSQRQSEDAYRLIVQGVTEYALVMLDTEARFATWNSGANHVLGYAESEMIGRHFSVIFTAEDQAAGVPERLIRATREKGESSDERWHVRKDGSRLWGSGMMTALYNSEGTLRGFAKVMRDNTDRKATEERLRKVSRAAHAANEAKDQFLATVSHELRTPLSAILLWSQIINTMPGDTEQLRKAMEAIQQCAEAQKKLIEDLLDTTRISSGKLRLNLHETDPTRAVTAALEATLPAARAKGVEIVSNFDPGSGPVMADSDRLQQIAWNLLANAVKFTPAGGRVDVMLRRNSEDLELEVRDTGKGIEPDFLPEIFSRFSQADTNYTGGQGGLGLGLTIARQLAELHGGTIAATSAGLGQGSTFVVNLPLPVIRHENAGSVLDSGLTTAATAADLLKGAEILLIDDDQSTIEALSATFRWFNARITPVNSGGEAIAAFQKQRFNLIISDIAMPDMDGYTLMKQIRAAEINSGRGTNPVPAIALSAFTREEDQMRSLASGFQVHVSKPVEMTRLLSAVTELLKSRLGQR